MMYELCLHKRTLVPNKVNHFGPLAVLGIDVDEKRKKLQDLEIVLKPFLEAELTRLDHFFISVEF